MGGFVWQFACVVVLMCLDGWNFGVVVVLIVALLYCLGGVTCFDLFV